MSKLLNEIHTLKFDLEKKLKKLNKEIDDDRIEISVSNNEVVYRIKSEARDFGELVKEFDDDFTFFAEADRIIQVANSGEKILKAKFQPYEKRTKEQEIEV